MFKSTQSIFVGFLLLAGSVIGVTPSQAQQGDETASLKAASVNGKYGNLLTILTVAKDVHQYGKFHDYGYYNGTSWAGMKGLPQGYWVYVYPRWYIWGEKNQRNVPVNVSDLQKATINGKYSHLLASIKVPKDAIQFGRLNDYGFYRGTSWAGISGLPRGYWVYVSPRWYIWGKKNGNRKSNRD